MSVWDESPLPPPVAGTSAAPPPPDPPSAPGGIPGDEPERPRRVLGLPIWLAVVLGSAICLAVGAALVFTVGSDGDTTPPGAAGDPAPVDTELPTTVPPTLPPTTAPPATTTPTTNSTTTMSPTTSTTAVETSTSTTITPTTEPAIPATTPTTEAATAATAAPDTTNGDPTSTVGPEGQRLTVTPRRGPCGAASDCLVVSFTIDGFATPPQTFVCEFASGRRYEFRFSGDGVDRACATNDVPDSIVVEVGGLRSEPTTNSR